MTARILNMLQGNGICYNPLMLATDTVRGVLQRLLDSSQREIPPDVARYFLEMSFSPSDQQRLTVLSEKANEGQLSQDEREELSILIVLADLLVIMQSKARMSLKHHSPAA